ncbi:MAG TPA: MFS transporter [Candidatus Hydrogenedentes bacterium]|nr:MFS transporter [Candidatus Hydrogenedentota bacterium]
MSRRLKFRLSLMMFLEYFVPGATVPVLSLYLKNHLHFPAYQVGEILAMPALAGFLAPFFMSHIADRFISSERLLGLCHLLAAGTMIILARQTEFLPFLALFCVYGLLFTPTFGLTNAIALHHVPDARRDFGGIRMWGTAGWVVVAWAFGYFWLRGGLGDDRLPHALYVSAFTSCVLAAYSFTLPRSHVRAVDRSTLMYWNALRVFAQPGLILLCVLTFVNSMVHQFYYFGMSPFLSQLGYRGSYIMPAMSIGQISEVIVLGLLGACLARIGIKRAMIIGALAQGLRYIAFAVGEPTGLILAAIATHGVCYAFFFTAGYIYIDRHSTPETRAGAQQIFTIMISGLGVLGGSLASGFTGQLFTDPATGHIHYGLFWLVPAALGLAVSAVLAFRFKEQA